MLPKIAKAVDGSQCKIIVDGGFLRGADICKGICAGADIVAMGRFVGLGMAAGGEESLVRAFDLLLEEMHTVMGLMGVTNLQELTEDMIGATSVGARFGLLSDSFSHIFETHSGPIWTGIRHIDMLPRFCVIFGLSFGLNVCRMQITMRLR